MKPHLEEARRSLCLADRDLKAFEVLGRAPDVHVVYFHAQQALEKSLKAVLFAHMIEFERTHDLVRLARLLGERGITLPATEEEFRRLNPFAVTFRYDDLELPLEPQEDIAGLVAEVRRWAGEQVNAVTESERSNSPDDN